MAGRFRKVLKKGKRLRNVAGAAAGLYLGTVRPWARTWGATEEEAEAELPGDDQITHPRLETTRAVTINADPEAIWPWLVQIGQDRAGFYSYDWLENLFGFDVHSAENIVPELQALEEGDLIRTAPDRDQWAMRAVEVDEKRALVLRGTWVPGLDEPPVKEIEPGEKLWVDCSWALILDPVVDGRTRLIARMRVDHRGLPMAAFVAGFLEPSQFVMERRMLLGVKDRAERKATPGQDGHKPSSAKKGQGKAPQPPAVEESKPETSDADEAEASEDA